MFLARLEKYFQHIIEKVTHKASLKWIFILVATISVFLRVWEFGNIPKGLNQDEVSAAYEALSLLETGKDRWGNPYPVYFPSWGRGQNVLYSYLCIPSFYFFGANESSFRLPNLLLNLFAILLVGMIFYREHPKKGLIAVAIVGLSPWLVVASRWALEENMLAFWLFLHFLLLDYAFRKNRNVLWLSFVPLSFASYTYALVFVSMPMYFILLVILFSRNYWKNWVLGWVAYICFSLPLLLFLARPTFSFIPDHFLWMSLPDMPKWPLYFNETWKSMFHTNLMYVFNGLHDFTIWNTTRQTFPHSSLILVFAFFGMVICASHLRSKNFKYKIWFAFFVSSVLPFFFFRMNLNRSFLLQTILLLLAIEGIWFLLESLNREKKVKRLFSVFVVASITVNTLWLGIDYFKFYPKKTHTDFSADLEDAIVYLKGRNEKIYVTDELKFPYLYAAFYGNISPKEFQGISKDKRVANGRYIVDRMENYIFSYEENKPFNAHAIPDGNLILLRKDEVRNMEYFTLEYETKYWIVVKVD